MRRRSLLGLIGTAVLSPAIAFGQQQRPARIGVLHVGNADAELFVRELRAGLRKLGYIEGQNALLELRSAEGKLSRLPDLAVELVKLPVDIIVAFYTPCALAAKQATREIPIVSVTGDPVETGLVDSLPNPGGNVTGLSLMAAQLHGKCVEVLHDLVPAVRRVAILANSADPVFAKIFLEFAQVAGRSTGMEIHPVSAKMDGIEAAFSEIKRERADAAVVQATLSSERVAGLAIENRLPTASIARSFVEAGGLLSYGADAPAAYRRAAAFVHKILQGAKPATLAVEQPMKFELAVNLRTAKAIGIEVPEPFLFRADTVIE